MTFSIVTIVKGRRPQLANHLASCSRANVLPLEHIVVAIDGPSDITPPNKTYPLRIEPLSTTEADILPLAKSRNKGINSATSEIVIVLDVDCIVSPSLFQTFLDKLEKNTITSAYPYYLSRVPNHTEKYANLKQESVLHPSRKRIKPEIAIDPRLFWSLAFCGYKMDLLAAGGFDETFTGYGSEDTDFAVSLSEKGMSFTFVEDVVLHQYHDKYDPPLNYLQDIVVNAQHYKAKHGVWPMEGWLKKLQHAGFIAWTEDNLKITKQPHKKDFDMFKSRLPY